MHRARLLLSRAAPIFPNSKDPERFGAWLLRNTSYNASGIPWMSKRHYSATAAAEPFLNGSSSAYVEEMYNSWLADPKSVHVVSSFTFLLLLYLKPRLNIKILLTN